MNQYPGIIGTKLGMSQIFAEDGSVISVTVIESRPVVVGKRTREKHGYDALVMGIGARKPQRTKKPLGGAYAKVNVTPRQTLRELRCSGEYAAGFEIGQEIKLDQVFSEGQFVDVQAKSRGRGFTGVMRRHNFAGNVQTHGTHEYRRHGGSIGTNMTPGRTLPGMKMPGQHGNKTKSVLTQRLVKILIDDSLLLVAGGVPGARNGLVFVRGAVKKRGGKPAA